jgi:hypothetical protein
LGVRWGGGRYSSEVKKLKARAGPAGKESPSIGVSSKSCGGSKLGASVLSVGSAEWQAAILRPPAMVCWVWRVGGEAEYCCKAVNLRYFHCGFVEDGCEAWGRKGGSLNMKRDFIFTYRQ